MNQNKGQIVLRTGAAGNAGTVQKQSSGGGKVEPVGSTGTAVEEQTSWEEIRESPCFAPCEIAGVECLGLAGTLFACFGALFIVLHSRIQPTCSFEGVIENCSDFKHTISDIAYELELFNYSWTTKALELRNASEWEKCDIEQDMFRTVQLSQHTQAEERAAAAKRECEACVAENYTATTPSPEPFNCTMCDRFCDVITWPGETFCSERRCNWFPQCEGTVPLPVTHAKCSACRKCIRPECGRTSTITTTTATVTTTIPQGFYTTTTTSGTTTSTTGTRTSVTTTLSTVTRTTTSTPAIFGKMAGNAYEGCICPAGFVDYVEAGPPQHVVYPGSRWSQKIAVEALTALPNGNVEKFECDKFFADKSKYKYFREPETRPPGPSLSESEFVNLGCGYQGTFQVTCKCGYMEEWERNKSGLVVDISTCVPPDYTRVLELCYEPVASKPHRLAYHTLVRPWLAVVDRDVYTGEPPNAFEVVMPNDTQYCCEVELGSTCKTNTTAWDPFSGRTDGFFPKVKCGNQTVHAELPCPLVDFVSLDDTVARDFGERCETACRTPNSTDMCNAAGFRHSSTSLRAHRQKIDAMVQQREHLRTWTAANGPYVTETKHVHDCINRSVSNVFLGSHQTWIGGQNLMLSNVCRLHGCKQNQCLTESKPCRLRLSDEGPESQCTEAPVFAAFECVDKAGYAFNEPLSFGIGIFWLIMASCLWCSACCTCQVLRRTRHLVFVPPPVVDEDDEFLTNFADLELKPPSTPSDTPVSGGGGRVQFGNIRQAVEDAAHDDLPALDLQPASQNSQLVAVSSGIEFDSIRQGEESTALDLQPASSVPLRSAGNDVSELRGRLQ